jgi:hypothetical protein
VPHAGDFEMWHRMALRFPVLLMPDGIVWYRDHEEQESTTRHLFLSVYEGIRRKYLTHPECPLPAEVSQEMSRKRKRVLRKTILGHAVRFRFSHVADHLKALSSWK